MLEIEEVIVNETDAEYDATKYLNHSQASPEAPLSGSSTNFKLTLGKSSFQSIPNEKCNRAKQIVRKFPIIRKPGEVVTPAKKSGAIVKVSSSTLEIPALFRPKTEYSNATLSDAKPPLIAFKIDPIDNDVLSNPEMDEMDEISEHDVTENQDDQDYDQQNKYTEMHESGGIEMFSMNNKLTYIVRLLEQVVTKQEQHDAALKAIKFDMNHLRADLKNTASKAVLTSHETNHRSNPAKRERKRLVVFPVADDNYLLQLEDLVREDKEIQADLIALFGDAPLKSPYDFLRKNVQSLFLHTSKYTWTGKSSHNNASNVQAYNPANELFIVELLTLCACDKFPHVSRDTIKSELRRALSNFNESRKARLKRGMDRSAIELMDEDEHSSG